MARETRVPQRGGSLTSSGSSDLATHLPFVAPDPGYSGFPFTPRHWLTSSGRYLVQLDAWEGKSADGKRVVISEGLSMNLPTECVKAAGHVREGGHAKAKKKGKKERKEGKGGR